MSSCGNVQVQDPAISSRLTTVERSHPDPLSPFAYESELLVSDANFSDTGRFTGRYEADDAGPSGAASTEDHLYVYVYGRHWLASAFTLN